jgi:prepilin-type N-terminal cleavage/methylation domain-containing protein
MLRVNPGGRRAAAFTLIELLVVIAIIALLIGILLPALGEARRAGKLAISLSNLKQFSVATATYSADFEDRIFAFTGAPNSEWGNLQPVPGNDLVTAARQAVDIIRRRTGRETFPLPSNWIPHVLYSHLVINDYLGQRLPEKMVVSPEDEHRLNWQIDPVNNFDRGVWQPYQQPENGGPAGDADKRWPYSSTYHTVPASYDKGQSRWSGNLPRISNIQHNVYNVPPNVELGNLRISAVQYPASKVHMYDSESRHQGRDQFYAIPSSRVPLNFFDSSAQYLPTSEANEGWHPASPGNSNPHHFPYQPRAWEAPTTTGNPLEPIYAGYYRWTRGGLKGADFNANEIDTGQL